MYEGLLPGSRGRAGRRVRDLESTGAADTPRGGRQGAGPPREEPRQELIELIDLI
jgi:hypothetical protein